MVWGGRWRGWDRNGRGPHLEGRQEPQTSSLFRTPTAGSLQSWDRRVSSCSGGLRPLVELCVEPAGPPEKESFSLASSPVLGVCVNKQEHGANMLAPSRVCHSAPPGPSPVCTELVSPGHRPCTSRGPGQGAAWSSEGHWSSSAGSASCPGKCVHTREGTKLHIR